MLEHRYHRMCRSDTTSLRHSAIIERLAIASMARSLRYQGPGSLSWYFCGDTGAQCRACIGTVLACCKCLRNFDDQVTGANFQSQFPANIVVLVCAFCSSVIALLAVVFPAVLDNNAPAKDTLQTWTCRWSDTAVNRGDGPPDQFSTICHETVSLSRFAETQKQSADQPPAFCLLHLHTITRSAAATVGLGVLCCLDG